MNDMKEYMKELDILYSMKRDGSKMCKKQDLFFAFVQSDSVIIDVKTLGTSEDVLALDENESHSH